MDTKRLRSTNVRGAAVRRRSAPPVFPLLGTLLLATLLLAGCGAAGPERTQITLLGTTDVHGHLLPWDYPRAEPTDASLAQIATVVDSIRSVDANVLLFDSGDFLQGSELTDYLAATGIDSVHPVTAAMNLLRYDAVAMGNHEYNHGLPFLYDALDEAEFPVLSANTFVAGTDSTAFPPYIVVERGGVRVGILGLTTPGVAIWDRDHVEGRLRFEDIVAAAQRWIPELMRQDPDLVVAIAHAGIGPGSTYSEDSGVPEEDAVGRLVEEIDEIDVAFAGHTAGPVLGHDIAGALVTHAGHRGTHLAVVHVTMEREAEGRWRVAAKEGSLLETEGVAAHEAVTAAVQPAHERTLEWLDAPIAYTPDRWSAAGARVEDRPIGDLITTVMRETAGAEVASTPILDPAASFGPGAVSRRDILALYVYPNRLKAIRVTGEQVRAYLEQSARYYNRYPADTLINDSVIAFNYDVIDGIDYRIDITRPVGERVRGLRYRGQPVTAADTFTLAINSYRQAGGGGFTMLRDAPVVYDDDRLISDLIVEYIQRRDTLRAADVFRPNWAVVPEVASNELLGSGATLPRF